MADKEKKFVPLSEIFDGYAKKGTEKDPTEVDILGRHDVTFTSDFVFPNGEIKMTKGHRQNVSTVQRDWYLANGVIEVNSTDDNKAEEKAVPKK